MTQHPYETLTPECILDAVDSLGHRCDGRLLALNSYENRVFEIGLDDGPPLIAKFYRPGRWNDDEILEEHMFSLELAEAELPVVAPYRDKNGGTLQIYQDFRFALFRKQPGRTPEIEDIETLKWMGRFMGRIHSVGCSKPFSHRGALNPITYGNDVFSYLTEKNLIPLHLESAFISIVEELLRRIKICYERGGRSTGVDKADIRLHGDCHPGNILWTYDGPWFVDFDDCRTGPAIQDLWMLLSGERQGMELQLGAILEGYGMFCDFDYTELHLIEALRALRMINYTGWLAKRRDDPAFKACFPWFNTDRYWEEQILTLREQAALLDEPPLEPKCPGN